MRRRMFGMTASGLLISILAVTGCGTSSGSSLSANAIKTSTTAPSKAMKQIEKIVVSNPKIQTQVNLPIHISGQVLNDSHQGVSNVQLSVVGLPSYPTGYIVKANSQGYFKFAAKWSQPGQYKVSVGNGIHSKDISVQVNNENKNIQSSSASPIVKHIYRSSSAATVAIQNMMIPNNVHPRNPLVHLGYGIRAQFLGGAGTYEYFWNEGRWQIQGSFMGPNNSGQKIMESVVAYLHFHMLPVPGNNGVILINDNSQESNPPYSTIKTTIAWNVGNKTYRLHYSGNPVSALRIAINSSVG